MHSPSEIHFDHLIDPLDSTTFFSEYFEKKPLVIKRENSSFFSSLLQLQDVDKILYMDDILNRANMRMVKEGKPVPVQQYIQVEKMRNVEVKSKVLTKEVNRLFKEEKATFILEQIKELWPAISRLLLSINDTFHCTSNANVYITPPDACGFDVHYDSHDVFVLQIAGAKHWKVYSNPYILPLGIHNAVPFDVDSLELLYDVELEAGDTLYMPRGFVHEAATSADMSAHITAGVYNTTLAKILSDYVVSLAASESLLRRSVLSLIHKGIPENELIDSIRKLLLDNLSIDILNRNIKQTRPTPLTDQQKTLFAAPSQSQTN
ncbi:cupin domain-containing protein [Chitinophaga pendula]|uniref:cupin domain-containing protein n=1 Tax=Chitinophaga TaxID=79328 RepID=UPI000BB01865|nr:MULTISPECIES: cupin domain-containing protein [Chitinophaga]ASZ11955.1 hypothetical protein CK934_13795 [Chitinophaga sp. MD30]UCJ05017.1 cupin domain-containing protein [Chitinophaga pendula]